MAVSLLAGFPVVAGKAANATATLATAAHSASGACKLVLCLTAEGNTGAITNTAITDSTGGTIGTWTRHVSKRWSGGSFNDFSWTEIWVADCSGAYTSKTVTLTVTGGGGMMAAMALYAVTGFDAASPFGAEDSGASTSDASSHLIAGVVTAATTGGLIVGAGTNGNASTTLAAQTGTTIDKQQNDSGVGTASVAFHKTAATSSGSAYTVGTTTSDQYWGYAIAEIKADSGTVTGTGAATFGAMTGSAAGSTATGTGAATLGAMTGSAAGAHGVAGTAAATLGAMTGAAAGSSAVGTGAATLGAMTGAATGAHGVAGTAGATLGATTGAGAGSSVVGAGAATLGAMTGAGTGSQSISGTGAATFGAMSGSASGTVTVAGTGSATFGDMQGEASGSRGVTGAGAAQFDAMAGTASGTVGAGTVTGVGAATFGAMTGAAFGTVGTFTASLLDGLKVRPLGETFVSFADSELEVEPKGEATRVVVLDQRG